MANCTSCGKPLPEGAKVCPYCGTKVAVNQVAFCAECGTRMEADQLFCPNCGNPRGKEPGRNAAESAYADHTVQAPAMETPVQTISRPEVKAQPAAKKRFSGLSITAFIFSLTGILSIPGVIMAAIDLKKNGRTHKKGLSIAALVISALVLVGMLNSCGSSKTATTATASKNQTVATQPAATKAPAAKPTAAPTAVPTKKPVATEAPTPVPTEKPKNGISPEFQAEMDAYEKFFDEYCEFMEQYSKNPSDFGMLMKYSSMMAKYYEYLEAFENCDESEMTKEEAKLYLQVQTRINKKLAQVVKSMG